MQILVKLITRI